MRTSRVVIALTVASGLLFTPIASVSAADTEGGHHPNHAGVLPLPLPGEAFIGGVVRDEHGRLIDNINVEAFDAGTEGADPSAAALTYEGPDSDHPHGFYRLVVAPGSYFIRFSSLVVGDGSGDGGDDSFQSQWYADKRVVSVGDEEILRLKPVTLDRARAESECDAALVDDVVPVGRHPKVRVRIKSVNAPHVTGSIKVTMNHHKVRTDRLRKLDHGRVVLRLPKSRPGTYRVAVSYAGSNAVRRSHSPVQVLRIVRNRQQPRPLPFNVW